jgi:hypothetical protein
MATELIQRGNPGYSKQQMQIKKASGTSPVPVAPSAPIAPVNPNNQVASVIGGKQYNAGGGLINPADIRPTIPAESIGNTPALNVPPAKPQTNTSGTNEFVASLNQAQKSEGQAAMDRQFEMDKAAASKSQTDLQIAMGDAATQGSKREELYKQYGVDQLSTSVAEIQNRIDATERSRLAQVSQLEKNPQGLFGGALQDEINRINRDFSKQQADDAITLNALTRNFTNMTAIADRQLEDYMAPIKANVDFQKELFKINQSNFTQTQRDALQYKIAQDEKKTAKIEADAKAISDAKIQALTNASKYGAPQSILKAIQSAKTVEEAILAGAKYSVDPMDRSIKGLQLRKLQQEVAKGDLVAQQAIVNSVVNEKDPTKLISNFFRTNPNLKDLTKILSDAAAVVSAIGDLSKKTTSGEIKGYGFLAGGFLPEALSSQEAISTRASISAIDGKVQSWLSGASLSKGQEALIKKLIPERNDTDATVKTKLNQLTNYMLADIKGRATTQGAQFEYIPADLWNNPEAGAAPEIKESVVQAVAAGYSPSEVIEFISQNNSDQAAMIQEARANGYSDDEIIQFLSQN